MTEEEFNAAANGDGELTLDELKAAIKAHQEAKNGPPAGPPPAGPPSLAQVMQGPPPSVEGIVNHIWAKCNKDNNDHITWAEAKECGAPEEEKKFFDDHAKIDGEDGLSKAELEEGVKAWLAKEKAEKEAAGAALAQVFLKQGPPSAQQILDTCDSKDANGGDGNGKLSKQEILNCIDKHAPAEEKAAARAGVEAHFDEVAGNDDEVDIHELEAAMNQ